MGGWGEEIKDLFAAFPRRVRKHIMHLLTPQLMYIL